MRYWDFVVRSHEKMSKDFPIGEEGLRAVRFLKSFFVQMGCEQLHSNHPLNNRLRVGSTPNYMWLVQYTRKLLVASSLSGFEQISKRLGDHNEYLAANNEMEVTLKLHLEGLDVSFSGLDFQTVSDLILRIGSDTLKVEVSSLHPPDEESRIWLLNNQIFSLTSRENIASGGFMNKIPSPKTIKEVIEGVRAAIANVKKTSKMKKLNFPGVATIYLAPSDKVDQIPKNCRRSFYLMQPHHRSIEEKIQRKIKEKSEQLFGNDEIGILFLYTQIIDRQKASQLFGKGMDEIEVILATYPKLPGLVLTVPHLGIEVASAIKSDSLQKEFKDNKVFLESKVGEYQYESSIIWMNQHAHTSFPKEILSALENYPSNLTKLESLHIPESYS